MNYFFHFLSFLTLLKSRILFRTEKQSSEYCEVVNQSREAEVKEKGEEEGIWGNVEEKEELGKEDEHRVGGRIY